MKGHGMRFASFSHKEGYIGGRWVPAASGKTFPVDNPANGKVCFFFLHTYIETIFKSC